MIILLKLFILIGLGKAASGALELKPLTGSIIYSLFALVFSGFNVVYALISFAACLLYLFLVHQTEDSFFAGLMILVVGAALITFFL